MRLVQGLDDREAAFSPVNAAADSSRWSGEEAGWVAEDAKVAKDAKPGA